MNIMYYNKYLKYKNKYTELKNIYGGAKKMENAVANPVKDHDFNNFIISIKKGLSSVTKIPFFRYFNTLKLTSNLVNLIDPETNLYPLQIYVNSTTNKDYDIIKFLLPTDLSLLEHLDNDGNTIFHKLVIQGDIDTLEEIYFDDEFNEEIRNKIKLLKNKHSLTILKLANLSTLILPDSIKEQLIKGIHSIYNSDFEEEKTLWLSRKHKSIIDDMSGKVGLSSLSPSKPISKMATLESASASETKKGKRKVWEDLSKNEKKLEEVQITGKGSEEHTTTKKKHSYTLEYLNTNMIQSYIDNDQITVIDTLYTAPLEFGETIDTKIPPNWDIKNIRFVNKEKLGSKRIGYRDFIVQLSYKLLED